MTLQQYLQALRKFWWIIVVAVLLGSAYGLYRSSTAEPEYRASVTFFVVAESNDSSASGAVQGDEFAQRRVNSYVALLSTDRLAEKIAAREQLDVTPAQVRRMIGASGDLDTVLLTATVTSDSRQVASDVGEALAGDFVTLVDEIEGGGASPSTVHLEVVSGPSVREVPPRAVVTVGLPLFGGLLLGLAVALLLELRDNSVRTEDQLRDLAGVPVLGAIPDDRRVATTPLVVAEDSMSVFSEALRQLRTNLQFLDVENPMQVLVLTSSVADEGKSVTSANLALSLAGSGYDVLLVEADLRRPKVSDLFGADRRIGITDVLIGRVPVDEALQQVGHPRLSLMPSGPLPPNPSELLGSDSMQAVIRNLRERFDVIILDTPPLLPVTDAAVSSAHADGILLVVRARRTTRHQVARAIQSLIGIGAPLVGTVMTMRPLARGSEYTKYEYTSSEAPGPFRRRRPLPFSDEARFAEAAVKPRTGSARPGVPPVRDTAVPDESREPAEPSEPAAPDEPAAAGDRPAFEPEDRWV